MSPQHDNGHQASGISHQRKAEEREKNIFDVLRNLPIALSRRSKRSRVEQRTKGKPQKLEFEYRQPDFIDHDYWRRTSRGKEKKKEWRCPRRLASAGNGCGVGSQPRGIGITSEATMILPVTEIYTPLTALAPLRLVAIAQWPQCRQTRAQCGGTSVPESKEPDSGSWLLPCILSK